MTDKTKRIILIAAGVLLCAALVVGIVSRLATVPMPIDPGTEQTIQGTPTKPDAPEHPGKTEKNHVPDDVPDADRNKETPPTYKPEQTEMKPQPTEPAGGSTNDAGQVYVPGFGYVTPSGPNTVIDGQDIYENGNKIGIMGG